MLLAALFVGALAAYYFGLRPGAWAAAATFALSLVAMFAPSLALPIHIAIAVAAIAIWQIGSRRPRPPDAVLAVRFVQRSAKRAWSKLGKLGGQDPGS